MAVQTLHLLRWILSGVTLPSALAISGILGVLSHRLYFIRGEHHMKAPLYGTIWALVSASIACLTHFVNVYNKQYSAGQVHLNPAYIVLLVNLSFAVPLFASTLTYRVFEHALKEFPGPRLAAVSKLWHFYYVFTKQNHLLLDDIHRKYGNFVRTGPQELTVFHPDVLDAISRHGTSCVKAPVYDMLHPMISLNSIRSKAEYGPRRKRWDEAFALNNNNPHIPDKEKSVHHFASLLIDRLRSSVNSPVNVTTWFYHFSFDFMIEISFGRSLDLTKSLTPETPIHEAPALISQGVAMLRYFSPAPWLGRICVSAAPFIPVISQEWNRALQWAAEMCDMRLERGKDQGDDIDGPSDAFSRFILASRRNRDGDVKDDTLERRSLYGDASAIVAAGSHTTAAVLTLLTYELARSPKLQTTAREEISQVMSPGTPGDIEPTKQGVSNPAWDRFPFLNGCINETLRLYPPIPTGGVRQTVDKPIVVGGTVIPPHTTIVAPRWSIGRLETAFEKPNEFIPERWTTKPDMVKSEKAFSPFTKGRHVCPGKQVGLLEVRMVMAMILANFEFSIAPTKSNQTRVVDDFHDGFTATPGALEIVFKPIK
ncbi:cytochrome P450 [Hypoxylon sp. FL1284]|nr:cytochrome P450 [Hypoxylon sp. FL1284]